MMKSQTTRMRRIIEDLLTLSRLENNVTLKDETDIAMPALLNQLQKDAQALSQGQHTVTLHMETTVNLRGSYNELLSALSNLTSNAVRYTPAQGKIDIYWQMRGEDVAFSVQDTGIGIEPQHLPRLTERFTVSTVAAAVILAAPGSACLSSSIFCITIRPACRLKVSQDKAAASRLCFRRSGYCLHEGVRLACDDITAGRMQHHTRWRLCRLTQRAAGARAARPKYLSSAGQD